MTDVLVRADADSADRAESSTNGRSGGWARPVALIAGVIAVLSALAVPLLPVAVDATTLNWPQGETARSVEAPLVSYAPVTFDAEIPCAAIEQLAPTGGNLVATAPPGAPDLWRYGFQARVTAATTADDGVVTPGRLEAVLRDQSLVSVPVDQLGAGCAFSVHAGMTGATATLTGSDSEPVTLSGDYRPQIVGIFSDLAVADGTTVTVEVDSRFSSHPSPLKRVAIWLALAATVIALVALYRLDRGDRRHERHFLPRRWWALTPVDGVVIGTLVLWHFIGATTSDDGYQMGMARTSIGAGYMANYFAYFGVPENPVGTPYYDLLGQMSLLSTASPWMRLPALLAGIVSWLVISREVIPRLGAWIRRDRIAVWTGALGFLAVWLPYNNGLRPEPMVALGVLLTWCSVERAIATRRLLPYAVACAIGALSVTVGPSGLICFAPLLAGIRPIWRIVDARARVMGKPFISYPALLMPIAAAGAVVLAVMFADQTLSAMFEMRRVHEFVGPNVAWHDEYIRYQYLLMPTIDGSVGRRFGIFMLWIGLAVSAFVLLRRGGRIPFVAAGPVRRLLGSCIGVMLLMMTTPTKWTHHNGVYAGLAGAVAVVAAVAVGPRVLRSPRNRALFAAIVAFALALVFSSINGWWYVSNYSISWNDKPVVLAGIGLNKVFLLAALLLLALAGWFHMRAPEPGTPHRIPRPLWRLIVLPPLTLAAALLVLFQVASLAKGAVAQYPAFSLAKSNINAVTGNPGGLAREVLVETDPNAGMLNPLSGDAFTTFAADANGFVPGGVSNNLSSDDEVDTSGITETLKTTESGEDESGTTTAALPFGLNPATTPVLGTDGTGEPVATLTTGWYELPNPGDRSGIIAVTAAGRIRSVDADGVVKPGQSVEIEYGTADSAGVVTPVGRVTPIDIGPAPTWRNLRVPFTDIPVDATVIRLVATDRSQDPRQWVALTPPRMPQTRTLLDEVGCEVPVLLDWAVGLQFPCQRPFDHRSGIAEVPEYRILPDRGGALITNRWQNHDSGGPLGWTSMLLRPETVATYLKDDWDNDWGELQRFTRRDDSAVTAKPVITSETHSGMWSPGPINTAGWQR
ncbi:arabinosyltransferase [Nocardia uniformis]|uniref:Arabinosyltransferase n=1 Tax=Nocardia uniformis TaxID=53432 RepID=A0A849C6U1_9NOCA|nr:arabinosyltransferase domain-containing protein [Nocardia uniformis]NNH72130.1 arabinosyltransferase [Nocardia uniformis]